MLSKNQSKFIKSLKIKKYRVREKAFLVEGRKNVLEVLNSPYQVSLVVGTEPFINANLLKEVPYVTVSPAQLADLGTYKTNQDCLAVVTIPDSNNARPDLSGIILAVDGLRDPGNLGTVIRTLDWFGFDQLVCSPDTAELYNPKVISATMGSFTRVQVYYTDLEAFISENNLAAYGADMIGIPLLRWHPARPGVMVMGSESHGIRPGLKALLHETVTITRVGGAESLNVGIATGIICHHIRFGL